MKMTNPWNRFVYRFWAPIYDGTLNLLFGPGRQKAMDLLALQPGESVLMVGVGTGADLPYLPAGVRAMGVDLSPEMLAKAQSKLAVVKCEATLVRADGQTQLVPDETFDAVILNLILSVIPDASACLKTAAKALKVGGRAVIFDKFLPDDKEASMVRQMVNLFSTVIGTDINRRMGEMLSGSGFKVMHEEASILQGIYRVILLKREV
jgi:phosphatidylethanolamine/phosphatidyl-N-methylethanolamine N-methyltransferase